MTQRITNSLLRWYEQNKRDLPWRNTDDPYKIWLSEVILQQTRVGQGLSYYLRFVEKYPALTDLAKAKEHDVLKLWQGLGYYSRARNMLETAKTIKKDFKGQFPQNYESLLGLKGIGKYSAAAIASFAFHLPYPVVDGNVKRVYARLAGVALPVNSTQGEKRIYELANRFLPFKNDHLYNQAVMELGARCCIPSNPNCPACPINAWCYAFEKELTGKLPVILKKTKPRDRYFYYLIVKKGNAILFRKRVMQDIWKGLHDFPCIELTSEISQKKLLATNEWKAFFKNSAPIFKSATVPVTHLLSHQRLHIKFIEVMNPKLKALPANCFWADEKQIKKYAVPKPIEDYICTNF